MACTIIVEDIATRERTERHLNSVLEDAKAYAEPLRAAGNKVSVRTDRGTLWNLVPRTRNTGPGRWRWERG